MWWWLTHSTLFVLILAAIQITAALFALRAVRTARTPQGAVGWVVFLFAAPHFAVPIFLILGHRRYPGYIAARRALSGVIDTLRLEAVLASDEGAKPATAPGLTAFERLARMPSVPGNATRLLVDGKATFDAIFEAIGAAQAYVLVQSYTIHDDVLGRALADRLIERAKAGIAVRVLYDAIGSNGLGAAYIERLRAAGVEIRNFHAMRPVRTRLQVNFRNHRKIVVVDGQVGFVGGLNVGDEYMGRNARLGAWRDTHLRLEGPAVAQLQLVFAEDWLWSSGEQPPLNWTPAPAPGDRRALILASGPADRQETGTLYFCNAIGAACERLWIASPYFVPDTDILTALKLAALRGVDVRILLPAEADHRLVWLAGHAYFDEVRAAGVKIYRYNNGFLHQKVVLIDGDVASVGSHNLDNRSARLNFEVSALVFDPGFAAEVAGMLEHDMERCERLETPVAEMGFWINLLAPAARLFAPIL